METASNLRQVLDKIADSAIRAGKNPDSIKLVAVSKTVELDRIIHAIHAGVTILGENRVQEARDKIADFRLQIPPDSHERVQWHLIGNLQKNKAKTAVELFDMIQSVDSVSLAEEINKYASKKGKIQDILVQVKLSDEPSKHGVSGSSLMELLEKASTMENLGLKGLMTIPPFFSDPEKTRPFFRRLRILAENAMEKGFTVHELSMGMSNDFETAIEEGATMVRVGSAIFGERHY